MSKSRSGAPRRVAAGLLAGALAVLGLALAPPAGAIEDVTTDRVAGPTRYSTAGAIAGQPDFDGATTAILATGENFPDALAASGLAGSNAPAPIILTQTNTLNDETENAFAEVEGLDEVLVVGGTAAVSDEVVAGVEDLGYSTDRIAGVDRYETAGAIADAMTTSGEIDGFTTALIASGEVFADAVAGGPVAYAGGMPILLVNTDGVPAATEAALDSNDIEQVVLLGGTARITDATEAELEGMVGRDAIRVAGVDRFATAAEIARFAEAEFAWEPNEVLLATGVNFPDALACGPLGGERSAPIILTGSWPAPSAEYVDEVSNTLEKITACGGTAAVSAEDLAAAEASGETVDNDAPSGGRTVTSAIDSPELQSATISGVDLDDLAIVYTYVFDEDVDEDTVDESAFFLMNADSRHWASGDTYNAGDDVDVDGENVAVTFNLADYSVAGATLAGVEEGAVEDEEGNVNPPQTVAVSGLVNSVGPGLLSAEITDDEEGIVEFTYGTPIPPGAVLAMDFELIARDGDVYTADGATQAETTPDDQEPGTVIEVDFNVNLSDSLPDAASDTIRRAISLTSAGGVDERIQAVDVGSGATDGPDLVAIQTASDDDDLDEDEALFIFDEAIDTAGANPGSFDLIFSHCSPTQLPAGGLNLVLGGPDQSGDGWDDPIELASTCAIPATSVDTDEADFGNKAVVATFPSDDIDTEFLVAGQVDDDAGVVDEGDTLSNENDEAEYDDASNLFDDGEVVGPQLVGASLTTDTNVFGDFDAYVATFEFDADLDDGEVLGGDFQFWYQDGEDVTSDTFDSCDYDGDRNVVCEIDDEDSPVQDAVLFSVDYDVVQGNDVYALDSDELTVQFPSVEASIEVELDEA